MNNTHKYRDIRPYTDQEVNEKINELLADPIFDEVLLDLFKAPEVVEQAKKELSRLQTIEQVQLGFTAKLVGNIIKNSTKGLTFSGIERLDKNKAYLFISNHRDIVLDSAFLNYIIYKNGMNTTQIAIGDNLFMYDWIVHAVKLNRSFVVKRNIGARELLKASQIISEYIRASIKDQNISVWIAQREGRTKDGDDQTQQGLLKMLHMSNQKSFLNSITELNIIPVSISYEIEPCGVAKVNETLRRERNEFQKTSKDDLKSMAMGVKNQKDRVHFSFGKPIHTFLKGIDESAKTNDLIQELSELIDKRIHCNFKLWPNNYIASDILSAEGNYTSFYTPEEKEKFMQLLQNAINTLNDDKEKVRDRFLRLYANPVINAKKYGL